VRILIIDFYDSFVYNLADYFRSEGCDVEVVQDDQIPQDLSFFLSKFNGVVLSPGPGLPEETHSMMRVIRFCESSIPILGVCLGMQGVGIHLGGTLVNLSSVRHGVSIDLNVLKDSFLFKSLTTPIKVGLYHSWALEDLPLEYLTACDEMGVAMAIVAEEKLLAGVQFHPESVMTSGGQRMIFNWVSFCKKRLSTLSEQ
jgi:anthranilate synthase component 2